MTRRGRPAQLPSPGYEAPPRLIDSETSCTVDFYPEGGGLPIRFDFTKLPVHHDLQIALAKALVKITGPSGTRHAVASARQSYWVLAYFARLVAEVPDPPQCATDLTIAHVDCIIDSKPGGRGWRSVASALRGALLEVDDLPEAVRRHITQLPMPPPPEDPNISSYTRDEEHRIILAARATVHAAAERIRAGVEFLSWWQAGEVDQTEEPEAWLRGFLLDYVAQNGDVPRYDTEQHGQVKAVYQHGGIASLMGALFLTASEAAAACALLICRTGVNGDALATTTIAHERADSGRGETPIAVIDVVKPRRGQSNQYMTVPLEGLPHWTGIKEGGEVTLRERDEFDTPFGIYMVLLELTAPARALSGSDRLFLWTTAHHVTRNCNVREGLPIAVVPAWGRQAGLTADLAEGQTETKPLEVTMPRLRLTYLQRHQHPVAHSQSTFDNQYMLRDHGSLTEYQRVVAEALHEQEALARKNVRALVMTADLRQLAASDPLSTAARCGVTVDTLQDVVDGRNDTVLAACVGFDNGPYALPGCDCEASFFVCLSCECARISLQHLPILLHTRDELKQRRAAMTQSDWINIFAGPLAQLDDVIGRFNDASRKSAQLAISKRHRDLVQKLLNREWDLT